MPEPTNEAIIARAEQLASAEGLDWVTMFRPADERSERSLVGDGAREEFLALARDQLIAEQTAQAPDA